MQQHKKLDDKIKELNSTRVYKKVTPIHDLSWYVKWVSVVFVIIGWMLHSINLFPYNIMIQMIGVAGWLWVGYLWHDRALIVLNSIGIALLGMGLLKFYFGV
jgi:energy-coupling factor transporter transmembrane protein EcfT